MLPLVTQLKETIKQEQLIGAKEDLFIALSGGADSVALLRAFILLDYTPKALHCNFHLRGKESDEDERFVRDLCQSFGVPLSIKHFDTEAYAKEKGISIEMAARELRYSWFQEERENQKINHIAVAHNADDMIETLLLNLSMGTGIRGLSGMPYKRHDGIIRPLMNTSRKTILDFLSDLGQSFREDSSNTSLAHKRNFIRHKLIPCFEELNPNFRNNSLNTIQNLRGTETIYLSAIDSYRKELISKKGLEIAKLKKTEEPKTILYELLRPYGFSREQILDLGANLANLRRGAKYEAEAYTLLISRSYLELLPRNRSEQQEMLIDISQDGELQLAKGLLTWKYLERKDLESLVCPSSTALFDAEDLQQAMGESSRLVLRHRQEGDKIKPFGMQKGKKKLRRIFIDGGFTHKEREEALLLTTEDKQILWLVNILADATYSVKNDTHRILQFSFKPSD